MACMYCKGTGKYKRPKDLKKFEDYIDVEMEKEYYVNYVIAEKKAYEKIGYDVIDCPYCCNESNT